ncbi:MAG: TetR/AcrR family transcriptional regulator [Spirochaetes bacterium]|nr:TetR/AcrR family transcriptional regulator [Spirochaetota bacterium]
MHKKNMSLDKIIKAAFKEWGKNKFANTSLTLISSKLGLSKAALYRYINSKEHLIEIMHHYYIEQLVDFFHQLNLSLNTDEPDQFFRLIIEEHIKFFSQDNSFMSFVMNLYDERYLYQNQKMYQEGEIFYQKITPILVKMNSWMPKERIPHYTNHLFSIIFFCSVYYKNQGMQEQMTENIKDIILHGVGNKDIKIDQPLIEKKDALKPGEIEKRDRILEAIANVAAREGIWNTTTDKIAKELGISKSSLYFYFKNKNEMLFKMIMDEILRISDVIQERQAKYKLFEEKLYSHFVTISSYLHQDRKFMEILKWLNFQSSALDKRMKKIEKELKGRNQYINQGIEENYFVKRGFKNRFFLIFLNFMIIRQIQYCDLSHLDYTLHDYHYVFRLYYSGISGRQKIMTV